MILSRRKNKIPQCFHSIPQIKWLYIIGAIAATIGNMEKAKEYWEKVININPENETGKITQESLSKIK